MTVGQTRQVSDPFLRCLPLDFYRGKVVCEGKPIVLTSNGIFINEKENLS